MQPEHNPMSQIFKNLPWLVAGAALYHLSCTYLEQREEREQALVARKKAEMEARARRLYRLATACQRGMLNRN